MITIKIGTNERRNGDINKRWIQDQVNSRKQSDEPICVRFHIECDGINIRLASRDCPQSGGGSRQLKKREQAIVDEWMKKDFANKDVNPGMVVSYLEFLKRVCG